jgi:hypothetical protein
MTAERMPHDHSQQIFQGQGTEVYRDEDRLLHHTNNAQRLGASALIGIDPFMVAHKSHGAQPSPAVLEADRQAIIKKAIQGRTIELASPTQESIFYFNPDKNAETPELA